MRGPRGGYRLAKERRRITVGEIVRVAESLDEEGESQVPHSDLGSRIVTPLIASLQDEVMARLTRSRSRICARARAAAGVDCGGVNAADFAI